MKTTKITFTKINVKEVNELFTWVSFEYDVKNHPEFGNFHRETLYDFAIDGYDIYSFFEDDIKDEKDITEEMEENFKNMIEEMLNEQIDENFEMITSQISRQTFNDPSNFLGLWEPCNEDEFLDYVMDENEIKDCEFMNYDE